MHIWDTAGQSDGDIHQHSRDFTSTILEGVLREDLYTYREDPHGSHERLTALCYVDSSGEYRVDITGAVRVTPVLLKTLIHRAGETYQRPAADFHRVTSLEVPLITRVTRADNPPREHFIIREAP